MWYYFWNFKGLIKNLKQQQKTDKFSSMRSCLTSLQRNSTAMMTNCSVLFWAGNSIEAFLKKGNVDYFIFRVKIPGFAPAG